MKHKIIILLILSLIIPASIYAQENARRKFFASIHSGVYVVSNEYFKEAYDARAAFINGISLGVPFTNTGLYFYGKGMYFQKKGLPVIYHYEIQEDGSVHLFSTSPMINFVIY